MERVYKDFNELPTALNAVDVAKILGLSRVGAYNLMNMDNFPTLKIGKRMVVSKENFIRWVNENSRGAVYEGK